MRRLFLLSLVLFVAIPGCSEPTAKVSGIVTFNGSPVPGATVTFFPSNNQTFTVDTGSDGRYSVPITAKGAVRVSVQMPPWRPPSKANPPAGGMDREGSPPDEKAKASPVPKPAVNPAGGIVLPTLYADPKTSGLSFDATGKDVTFDIPLK